MTWIKLDQDWPDRMASKGISRDARQLLIDALSYSNRLGLDGSIARTSLARMTDSPDPDAAMAELVAAGEVLVTNDGWMLGPSLADQLPSDEVQAIREDAKRRAARQRKHKRNDHSDCSPRYCDRAVTDHVTSRPTGTYRAEPDRKEGKARKRASSGARRADALAPSDVGPVCVYCANPAPAGLKLVIDENGERRHPDEDFSEEWEEHADRFGNTCPPMRAGYDMCGECFHAIPERQLIEVSDGRLCQPCHARESAA